jgi:hypothetical protein
MANSTVTLTATDKDISRRKKILTISVAIGAGNYVPGGLPCDLTKVLNPKLLSGAKPATLPKKGVVINSPAGYNGEFILGATMQTCLLKIYSAPGTELAAGATPAAIVADPFQVEISGPLGAF